MMAKVDVILPAGGRLEGDFAQEAAAEIKALIILEGRTVLERTIEVLRATGRIGRIVVVGPEELAGHTAVCEADAVLPEGKSGPDNVFHGIEWLRDHNGGAHAERVLVVTTDLPFLTPEAVIGFLDACPPDATICIPVIRREAFEARFPGSSNTYVRLRDGQWTMGCTFLLDPCELLECRPHLDRIFEARKSQIGMARLLGLPFIWNFLTHRLTVERIAARCSEILDCRGAAVQNTAPELAFDIDLPDSYRYARQHMRERRPVS